MLDDIGPLRQLTPAVATAAVHLFEPRDVVRPVDQAAIDYELKSPALKITLEILDAQGATVRTFKDIPDKLDDALKTELARFNRLLIDRGIDPIRVERR